MFSEPIGRSRERALILRHWHQVDAGQFLGTKTWFADGFQRLVWKEKIWRCACNTSFSSREGRGLTYVYAYDSAAFGVAISHIRPMGYYCEK